MYVILNYIYIRLSCITINYSIFYCTFILCMEMCILLLQIEISKRLSAIITQILPFLSQEHQQQVATAVERTKNITVADVVSIYECEVSITLCEQTIRLLF